MIISTLSYAQSPEKALDSLIVESLYALTPQITPGEIKYIEPNEFTLRLRDNIHYPYKLLIGKALFNTAYRARDRSIQLIRIVPRIISEDTVDINWGQVKVEAKKGVYFKPGLHFRKMVFMLSCGGTNGYQPDLRYVYNLKKATWERSEK